MKIVKAYKLVERSGNTLYSYGYYPGRIKYKPNEWATPLKGCGPLGVFKTLEAAKEFISSCNEEVEYLLKIGWIEIWECEAKLWSKKLPRDKYGVPLFFWSGESGIPRIGLPADIYLCEAVKLTKRVLP